MRSTVAAKAQTAPHSARSPRKAIRSCGKHAVSTTIIVAPITVPIIRNQPLRSEAPSCGWHTIAAEVPAQKGLSSSSQNATKSARQTEAQSRTPKSSGARPVERVRQAPPRACRVASHASSACSVIIGACDDPDADSLQCCICISISSAGGIMLSFRSAMIHSEPTTTRITMSTPNASASTLLVLSGPVVMCRKNTR